MNQVNDLIERHGSDLALVINTSGGKDSVRMLGMLRALYPNQPTYAVYADTGFEHVKPVSAEDWARDRCRQFDMDLNVVRNPNKTYLQMVEARGMFPDTGNRQCTSDLKRGPIEKFIRNHVKEPVILNCMGIRAAESPKRSKLNPWVFNESLSIPERRAKDGRVWQKARTVYNWMPIFRESLRDVLQWHWDVGVPLHPAYTPEYHQDGTQGGYLRRFSCRVCIFSTNTDLHAIHEHDPEAFYAVAHLEERMGFTMKNGQSLFQILQTPLKERKQYGSEELVDEPETPCTLWDAA